MLKFTIAAILSGILISLVSGSADAQKQKSESYVAPDSQVQAIAKTEQNLWGGLSLAPNETTPISSSKRRTTRDSMLPTSKSVFWVSDCVTFEDPIFDEPMLERYGITSSAPDLRTGARFYLKGLTLPVSMITGRYRACVSPTDPQLCHISRSMNRHAVHGWNRRNGTTFEFVDQRLQFATQDTNGVWGFDSQPNRVAFDPNDFNGDPKFGKDDGLIGATR